MRAAMISRRAVDECPDWLRGVMSGLRRPAENPAVQRNPRAFAATSVYYAGEAMKTHLLLPPVVAMLACCDAMGQAVQNMDISYLAGPVRVGSRVLPGTDVTLNGGTSPGMVIGYGYQVARRSAASLWIDVSPVTSVLGGGASASIPGFVSNMLQAHTAEVRLMFPLQTRVSAYGLLGGGVGLFRYAGIIGAPNRYVTTNTTFHGIFLTGGGIDVRLTRHISLRGEIRDLITGAGLSGASGRHHVLPMFGIAFHF